MILHDVGLILTGTSQTVTTAKRSSRKVRERVQWRRVSKSRPLAKLTTKKFQKQDVTDQMQFVVLRLNRTCAALAFMFFMVVNSKIEISIQAADNNDSKGPQDGLILSLMLFGIYKYATWS